MAGGSCGATVKILDEEGEGAAHWGMIWAVICSLWPSAGALAKEMMVEEQGDITMALKNSIHNSGPASGVWGGDGIWLLSGCVP